MPRNLTQYRIFIGSPGGLDEERKLFRETLERYTKLHAEPRSITFYPVAWEDRISGAGRPQALINQELSECDYAIFLLHDRWGSPTGKYSCGFEEEWALAEQLYKDTQIRNIALFFKDVAAAQLDDPGEQLKKVLAFKQQIEEGKKYLFKRYAATGDFPDLLEAQLAKWQRDNEATASAPSSGGLVTIPPETTAPTGAAPAAPSFDYWIAEADTLMEAETPNYSGALFCLEKASTTASSEGEWARAKNLIGAAHFYLNNLNESLAAFSALVERFDLSGDTDARSWQALALFNKGVTLGKLGRSEEEVAVYDDLLARSAQRPNCLCANRLPKRWSTKGSHSANSAAARRQ